MYAIRSYYDADCIFIIGSNTFEQHPLIARRVIRAKEKGTKIIVIDPRYTPTAKQADLYLQLREAKQNRGQIMAAKENRRVITSYSIHYTKLYDPL